MIILLFLIFLGLTILAILADGEELKPCPLCGRKPIIEHWSSGGTMYMVKCNNPDCPVPVTSYPTGHNLDEVIAEWNRRTDNEQTN